jgi:glycosyltransferase involved in cell wall biosynthesis
MRILHIVGTISPAAGGPTEVIRTLVRFAPPGYESEVATLDDPTSPFLSKLGFPVHALGSARKKWYVPAFSDWLAANRTRFDGVMVHGLWEYTGLAAMRTLAGKTPYVVFTHGMLDPYFKHAHPKKHLKKWVYWLPFEYWVLRRAFRALFTTQIEAELARQTFWLNHWQPMVVAIGAEPPPSDTAKLLATFHAHSPELAGKRFLLFLGRIDPKKGCDLLVSAFAEVVASQYRELHLVMAGPDVTNWQQELQRVAEQAGCGDRVHWPGMLTGEVKWGAMAASEVFALTSHQENFGIAIVEALASGKPVLITRPVNISPDIEADGCGYVEADTLEGAKRLLQRWLATCSEERAAMAKRALTTFAARYDMRKNAETILRVFEAAPTTTAPTTTKETR